MDFLNAGGNPDFIRDHIVGSEPSLWAEEDLTGDGVPELVMSIFGVNILMCSDGQYIAGLHLMIGADPFPGTVILAIKDMNLDGVPELVLRGSVMSAGVMIYRILEWNGKDFHSLIWSEQKIAPWFYTSIGQAMNWYTYWSDITLSADETIVRPSSTAAVRDTDGNGTLELLIHSDIPVPRYLYGGPYRETTETYQWNGFYFSLAQLDIDPPVYRFQAVEDADRLSLLGKYQQAMDYYQEVISSKKLAVWSQDNYHAQFLAENNGTPTPTFIPSNQDEYGNLAAYALYRIMLLQLLQNESGAAKITYNDLEKTYPQDQPGHLYDELATVFWEKYNVSQNMSEACSEAIRFAEDHKDNIYTYLGNAHDLANTHGGQSHNYTSWDLCPFK